MHARGSGEAARGAKRGRQPEKKKVPLPSRAISHARGRLRVSRLARRTTEKRETARSLIINDKKIHRVFINLCPRQTCRGENADESLSSG